MAKTMKRFCFKNICGIRSIRGCSATVYYVIDTAKKQVVDILQGEKQPRKICVNPDKYAVIREYTSNRGNISRMVLIKPANTSEAELLELIDTNTIYYD